MQQAEMSCGHKVPVAPADISRAQRIAADLATKSKPNPPASLRCPRCGKVGVIRSMSSLASKVEAPLLPNPRPETRPANPQTPPPAPPEPAVDPVADAVAAAAEQVDTPAESGGLRIVIGGGPRTGKTTLAGHIGGADVLHTDDLIDQYDWSAASEQIASQWLPMPGPWILEGVATIRGLRKALTLTEGPPCDLLVWLTEPKVTRTPKQESMAKGCQTIFDEIRGTLEARGVRIEIDPA